MEFDSAEPGKSFFDKAALGICGTIGPQSIGNQGIAISISESTGTIQMEIKEQRRGKVKIVGLCGRLDANSSQRVENQLLALINQGEDRLVFDFSELTYMSSLGLRVLMMVAKNMQKVNGKLALAGLNDHIYEIFKIARFTDIFSIYPNCDEAVAHCAD